MKKIIAALLSVLFIASSFAEITWSKRFLEVGANASVTVNQNLLSATEIFKETIVIDLPKINENIGDDGLVLNLGTDDDVYVNFNLKKFGIGIDIGAEGYGTLGTGKGFIYFLAYGNPDGNISTNFTAEAETYANFSVPVRMQFGKLKVKATPTYYIPIVYVPTTYFPVTVTSTSDESIKVTASGVIPVYSIVDLSLLQDTSALTDYLSSDVMDILSHGGFCVALEAEYPLLSSLSVGGYAQIPIIPGTLTNKTEVSATFSYEEDDLLTALLNNNVNQDYTLDYSIGSSTACNYSVNKPLRLGGEVVFKPFGNWFVLNPMVGVACKNPFGEDFSFKDSMFLEYDIRARMTLIGIIKLYAATSYIEKVYTHQAGLGFDLFVAELNVKVGTSGTDFIDSFKVSGLKAVVGVTVGL